MKGRKHILKGPLYKKDNQLKLFVGLVGAFEQ